MKILVTGGAGMVGSHAAEYFAKRKHKVIVMDNLMRSTLFGYDEPGVYDLWVTLAPPNSPAALMEAELIESLEPDADGSLHIPNTFTAGIPRLSRDARQRGLTASLFLSPYGESDRLVTFLGHISRTATYEIVPIGGCDALFGYSDPGAYDVRVTRAPHDPGLPLDRAETC